MKIRPDNVEKSGGGAPPVDNVKAYVKGPHKPTLSVKGGTVIV